MNTCVNGTFIPGQDVLDHDSLVPLDVVCLLSLAGFGIIVWVMGRLVQAVGGPAAVGHVVAGVVLGPHAAGLLYGNALDTALQAAGDLGLCLLVVEAGLQADMTQLRRSGVRACVIALTGMVVPIVTAVAVLLAWGMDWQAALVASASLGSTSVGMTAAILMEARFLRSPLGQVITAGALVDDVGSLVIVGILKAVRSEHPSVWSFMRPFLGSVVFLVVGSVLAVKVGPRVQPILNNKIATMGLRSSVALASLLVVSAGCVVLASMVTSYLIGAFFAGALFSRCTDAKGAWDAHVLSPQTWLVRMFFAASIGFTVPLGSMVRGSALGLGVALTCVAIGGKLVVGVFGKPLRHQFWCLGSAFVARGEFGFLIAKELLELEPTQHRSKEMLQTVYAAVVWAVLVATIVGPFVFRRSLKSMLARENGAQRMDRDHDMGDGDSGGRGKGGDGEGGGVDHDDDDDDDDSRPIMMVDILVQDEAEDGIYNDDE